LVLRVLIIIKINMAGNYNLISTTRVNVEGLKNVDENFFPLLCHWYFFCKKCAEFHSIKL
jgi:ABC-type transporter Mla MlaB component